MGWLAEDRAEMAAERILDAAGRLFAELAEQGERGVTAVGMDAVARAAGCSRATLYRYFDNRHALLTAYAHREARAITERVRDQVAAHPDRAPEVEAVLACLAEVRSHPQLSAWYASGQVTMLAEILRESPLIESFAARSVGARTEEPDRDLARWVIRAILSFLSVPGEDEDEERRLVERFLAPHMSVGSRRP